VRPLLYLPLAQHPISQPAGQPIVLNVRMSAGATTFARDLTHAIESVDRQLAPENISTVEQSATTGLKPIRLITLLFLSLAGVAIGLALMGVWGISAFAAVRRSREIGIRMALGATRRDAVRLILSEAFVTAVIGVALGIIAALFLTGVLRQMLFNVSPTDPTVFTIVTAALALAALAASYFPARRVLRVDPAATLRAE
jgi:putative ABC transport system permease protein